MAEFIGKRVVPAHAGAWSSEKEYEPLMVVLYASTGDSYMSKKTVPAGTAITDDNYWALCANYSAQMQILEDTLAEDVESMEKTVSDAVDEVTEALSDTQTAIDKQLAETLESVEESLTETTEELTEKVEDAVELTESTASDIEERMDSIETRLDANVTASTDEDADYAAEVVDARVDALAQTHDSLGDAIRSITSGLAQKIIPSKTSKAQNNDNTASISADGGLCACSIYYEGSGYAGVFAGFFGTYDECKTKKFRVYIFGSSQAELEALITNSSGGWGSSDGTVSNFSLGTVSLTEDNDYFAVLELDCSEDAWANFAASYTTENGLFFCLRGYGTTEVDAEFSFYAREVGPGQSKAWNYNCGDDDVYRIEKEIVTARGDYDSLSEKLQAQEEELDERIDAQEEILQEVTDAHTDTRGIEYDTLSDRLALLDALTYPKLSIYEAVAPRDNTNGTLTNGDNGVEVINNNVIFDFDYEAYTTEYDSPAWDSLNFSLAADYDAVSAISDLEKLYVELELEDADGDSEYDGEEITLSVHINGYSHWGTTLNKSTTVTLTVGEKIRFALDSAMVENVLAAEKPLYFVFIGSGLNTDLIAGMGHIRISAAFLNMNESDEYLPGVGKCEYADEAEYAQEAGNAETADSAETAETADYATSAGTAEIADNFFIASPEELLNEDGVRYSEGMDSTDIPEYPYSYKYSFQSTSGSGLVSGSGYGQKVEFSMTLTASSSQPSNQGYIKYLNGLLSFDDMFEKFKEGYADCCVCTIEDTDYPENSSAGDNSQRLLISYVDESRITVVNVYPVISKTFSGSKQLFVWRFSISESYMEAIQELTDAGSFAISWYGIWNTRKYTEEEDAAWNPVWYWQDFAFTDGSFTDDEIAEYFQAKYTYWASYVNHVKLKERFEELDEWQEGVENSLTELDGAVDELSGLGDTVQENSDAITVLQGGVTGIVCWGDSLTAGGGWTTTLASLSGLTVYNAGTGGENAKTIMARQGGDVMLINDITIPADCEAVTIATYADDGGLTTAFGNKVTPLLQSGSSHVNPVMIGDVEGTLEWTGESYSDTTGTWTFTRSEAGDEVVITRPTAIRTAYDRNHNGNNEVMIIFMGQNGGYNSDVSELIRMHRLMIDHFKGKEYVILGLSSGTASSRADYEEAMEEEFGRRFISLRECLSYPIYDEDGETIISCYGLDDAGLDATDDDLEAIAEGQVPSTLLSDSVHYTTSTKTVIGTMLYKKMVELGIL